MNHSVLRPAQFRWKNIVNSVQSINTVNNFHTQTKLTQSKPLEGLSKIAQCQEIKIPVPWGHIAGKWWGDPSVQPVLALHGVQDNAATFDGLAPLLNVDSLLALDIPGHGLSSYTPPGFLYDFTDGICVLRFVIKHFYKWEKPVILLGHSFGSSLSFVYSAIYPSEVSKYISIDCARHHMTVQPGANVPAIRKTIEETLKFEKKTDPPGYSKEELLERLYLGRRKLLTKKSCETLLSRGTATNVDGKVYLGRDIRLKLNAVGRLPISYLLNLAPLIKCSHLSIQASNGTVKDDAKGEVYKKSVEAILKNSHLSRHVILKGNHHLHLDNPQPVADEINKFLSES